MSQGKGSARRPATVASDDLQARWAATFRQTPMRTFAPAVAEPDTMPHTESHERDEGDG
jgi:hypothetical protein